MKLKILVILSFIFLLIDNVSSSNNIIDFKKDEKINS